MNAFVPHPDDSIIVIMGPTGSGKTNFINALTGNPEEPKAGHLGPPTWSVIPHTISRRGRRLVLVDTPGFDDTYQSDIEILRLFADWITKRCPNGETLKLTGIMYLHRITDNRMSGSAIKNLQMFGRLCGTLPLRRARLVTTMWDIAQGRPGLAVADDREKQLIDEFWRPLIAQGAVAKRFANQPGSAFEIVDELVEMEIAKEDLLLQEELVKQQKRLNETEAGKVVYARFQRLFAEQKRALKELADEAKSLNDPALAESLQEEYDQTNALLQKMVEEMKEMKISIPRRITLSLFGGETRGKAIKLTISR